MNEAIVKINSIEDTNAYSKTIRFDWNVFARPGQFIMVWAPGMELILTMASFICNTYHVFDACISVLCHEPLKI